MNIISKEPVKERIEDGIDTILGLDDEKFNEFISVLKPNANSMEYFHFYYTTDGCEMPNNPEQLGIEKTRTKDRKVYRKRLLWWKNMPSIRYIKKTRRKITRNICKYRTDA